MPTATVIRKLLEEEEAPVSAKAWGYVLPARLVRKLGISGVSVKNSSARLGLKAALLDREKVSIGALGKVVSPAGLRTRINVTRLGRRQGLSLGASTVIPLKTSTRAHGHLLRSQKSSIKVVSGEPRFDLVAEVLGLLELSYTYMFVAVGGNTCQKCMNYSGKTFSSDEIDNLFPYAVQVDYSLIMPMVHPYCSCILVLQEVGLGGTFLDKSK